LDYRISSLPATSPLRSPIKYLKYHYMHEPILFSEKELSVYNGTDTELPLYVAVNGTVFDVSDSGRVYGPGGSYAFFGGKECAFALATNCLNYKGGVVAQGVTLELEPEETRRLKGWREFFEKKYFAVGRVVPEEAEGVENRAWRIQDRGECFGKGYA
jgi:predicted heme/steroid binding protein